MALTKREVAFAAARLVYRDTSCIEDAHSSGTPLDENSYKAVHDEVADRMDRLLPLVKLMHMDNRAFAVLEGQLTEAERTTVRACRMVVRGINGWQPAVAVEKPVGDNLAAYLLEGSFKRACTKNAVLTQSLMKEINIDVHNRMYTIINEIIPD